MARPGAPLTRQRSSWLEAADATEIVDMLTATGALKVRILRRQVHDGELTAIISLDGGLWHASVSHRASGKSPRYPTWDELAHARYELLPSDIDVVMHLPPPSEFVALHDTTFHLHELKDG